MTKENTIRKIIKGMRDNQYDDDEIKSFFISLIEEAKN